jgi:hypothetical protein
LLDKPGSLPFSLRMNQNASSVIANALDDLPGDLRRAVIKEFEKGIQKEWVQAGIQQKRIAKDSQTEIRSIDGIGRLRMRIDPTLYHAWGTKYGYDCWKDSQFLREIERDNPEVRVKCGGTRLQVGWQGGTKRSSQKFTL